MGNHVSIKVCGITNIEDARLCVRAGVDALGVNFVPRSPRAITWETAQAIVQSVGSDALVVGVVADVSTADLWTLKETTGVGCLQLHGRESAEDLQLLLPHAYKAVAIAGPEDVETARSFPGDYLLVDAKDDHGGSGGTGKSFSWNLVTLLAKERRLTLAGGLTPENVGRAILIVTPFGVDVASGVESPDEPRRKDERRINAFVDAVRAAETFTSRS